MRRAFASLVFFCACGGPTQQQIAESPAATKPPRHTEPAPATASEQDRDGLVRSFDDMQTTQQGRREVQNEGKPTPPKPRRIGPAQDIQPAKSTKKPVAEQAPPPKKPVAEQAPSQ